MLLNHLVYKKTTINAGRKFQYGINTSTSINLNRTKQAGLTLIELLFTLSIVASLSFFSFTYLNQSFYYFKTAIIKNKIIRLLTTAQNIALISHQTISVCAYDFSKLKCSTDWHNPIIIFYNNDNLNLSDSAYNSHKIIYKYSSFLNSSESICVHQLHDNSVITFNFKNLNPSIHSSVISYTNLYYNEVIKVNKIGRIK